MASPLRLRLVVRRNGLPETNIIWPVAVENKPTIAKLLEDVNQILPLESADWGLEDYAVELKGSDGTFYECLHFQPVQSVLKEDDQVFIRPLFTDDLRQRRVSGRHQISNDGRHLIDGLAFGRPLLGAPRGRPVFDIPPRKRRRVGPSEQELDSDEDDEDDADYDEPQEEQEPMLLLTNGEEEFQGRRKSVRIAADFDNVDSDNGPDNENDEVEDEQIEDQLLEDGTSLENASEEDEDDDMEYEQDEVEDDLEKELADLQNSAGEEDSVQSEEEDTVVRRSSRRKSRQTSDQASPAAAEETDAVIEKPAGQQGSGDKPKNEIDALLTAFPTAPVQVCQEVLAAEVGDLRKSYLTLSQAFAPKLPESELLRRWQSRDDQPAAEENPENLAEKSHRGSGAEDGLANDNHDDVDDGEDMEEDEDDDDGDDDDDEVTPFIKRFDRQGLPPGTISSGNALKAMAGLYKSFENDKSDSNSKSTSQTLTSGRLSLEESAKANDNEGNEDEEETSSSGTSSSFEEGEVEDDTSSDDTSSSDEEAGGNGGAVNGDGSEASDTSSSEDDSDSDSDSAPEEVSAKTGATTRAQKSVNSALAPTSSIASSSSSEESDADDETSSDDSSEEDSSDEDTSSESESEETEISEGKVEPTARSAPAVSAKGQSGSKPAEFTGVPGTGKIATKKRNERRRMAAKHKAAQSQSTENTTPGTAPNSTASASVPDSSTMSPEKSKAESEKELFEAKRKALLEALASGGIEVGPNGDSNLDGSQVSQKRKRDEVTPAKPAESQQQPSSTATGDNATNTQEESPSSMQKRRRLDLGAGRRMLFGALGLRNPKNKDDEEKLRDKLMKDVKPLQNARLVAEKPDTEMTVAEKQQELAEVDENAWRAKITYRAVECCQEGVELSEPPFPFVQRWDPQQQYAWFRKNKRGGKGKKAERNQSHFYQQDDSRTRSHDESQEWVENYQDTTFNSAQQLDDVPMELNYDDVEEPDTTKNVDETTRLTDIDDLPSLPKNLEDLPPLRPGDAQNGMVITWKQFILSKATNWQPEVLNLTGVICRIDDDATGLEVMLAKRDRDLEQTEKQYDELTGQRVYDKFDAPDSEDEVEEDEETRRMNDGYRTLSFSAMMEPRVLQPAIPLEEAGQEPTIPSIEGETKEVTEPREISTNAEATDEPASQAEEVIANVDCTSDLKDTTFEGFDDTVPPGEGSRLDAAENKASTPVTTAAAALGQEPASLVEGTAQLPSVQVSEKAQSPAEKSISDHSQVSSPSRQLHDETTSVLYGLSAGDEQSLGPSYDDIPLTPSISAANADMMVSDPIHDQDETSIQIHETDVITGTPRFTYPRPEAPPSSTSSIGSGRQLDLSMDLGVDQPQSFRADSIELDDNNNPAASAEIHVTSNDEETTPVPPSPRKDDGLETPKKSTPLLKDSPSNKDVADSNASTPCSLASLGTVWCTAASSRRTQSPSKSQLLSILKSQKSEQASERDLEYEAAMRKLDNFSDDDEDDEASQSASKISDSFASKSSRLPVITSSFSAAVNNDWNMGNDPVSDRLSSLPTHARTDVAISPPPTTRRRAPYQEQTIPSSSSPPPPPRIKQRVSPPPIKGRRKSERVSSSRFSLPPGTQVLEISSDSDEPKFTEHYADDDKDENYSPANDLTKDDFSQVSLPRGSGWVKKTRLPKSSSAPVASQKKIATVNRAASTSQSSYGSQMKRMESAAAAMKRLNKGRKPSARF